MTLSTFTPPIQPSVGLSKKPQLKILSAEFGDGYSQDAADGLNYIRNVFELNWEVLTPSQSDIIETFLLAQGGITPFLWLAPGDNNPTKVVCKDWEVTYGRVGYRSIKATFRQSFNIII